MANSSDSSRDSLEYFDAQRAFPRSRQASHDDEKAKIASSSAPLSMLLIPSLKEVRTKWCYIFSFTFTMLFSMEMILTFFCTKSIICFRTNV
ncbi:hypothetical protein SLEP1_g54136 [Rubroshorea leprosula]|uniref:Uncharacterized protein n=1 Tax=Rubroshorea leprosula TaxID=152421 RepID=A0AAV5MDD7_9ROSI|nr:hypothetical protein SLEP1_g54136 [Rubroshorea leprosula]